ncbi:type II membrane protein [Elasticomyces elasticus]|nr:type II membrane protein [Elasticomyces elasticus]KAK4997732.1 type II membrane protein [Elasticomyces elasticus]
MRQRSSILSLPSLLTLPILTSAISFDCTHTRVDGQSFDLSKLGGAHSVHWIQDTPPSLSNTTFTIDICTALKRTKGVPKENECPSGTRVCGIEYDYNLADGTHSVKEVIPIAGDYVTNNGRELKPEVTRLKNSESHSDSEKEGLRVTLNGGRYPFDSPRGTSQKAIIEFLCDPERSGLEGDEGDSREKIDDEAANANRLRRKEEQNDDKDKEKEDNKSLRFVSYKKEGTEEKTVGTLRLQWKTKYACEGKTEHTPSEGKSTHWGFFTWFIIVFFLAVAAYLVFGSWLNYSRYGARGWDLVPHGDTIRDIPYIVKDLGRSIASKAQGSGSRGGYSAV